MKKAELEELVHHIFDIASGNHDPYAQDEEKIVRIRDLCAQAIGKKELIPGAFPLVNVVKRIQSKRKIKKPRRGTFGEILSAYDPTNRKYLHGK